MTPALYDSDTTGTISGTGTGYPLGADEFIPGISGVRVNRYLACFLCRLYIYLLGKYDYCLSLCLSPVGHCIFCPSVYDFCVSPWNLDTFLVI